MWVELKEQLERSYFFRWRRYKNDVLFPEKIKEIYITPEYHPIIDANVEIIIRFINAKEADLFFKQFLFLYLSYFYLNDFEADLSRANSTPITIHHTLNNEKGLISDVVFSLKQKTIDLEKVCAFLDEQGVNSEILSIIQSSARQLTDLEKIFYEELSILKDDKESFSKLLDLAQAIVAENYKSNALWELAVACRTSNKNLIEEWFAVLHCISKDNNYYAEAQNFLAMDILAKFGEIEGKDIVKKQELFKKGIKYISNIISSNIDGSCYIKEKDITELASKMVCSFLDHPWQDQERIFPARAIDAGNIGASSSSSYAENMGESGIIDRLTYLLTYTYQLREENKLLRSQRLAFLPYTSAKVAANQKSDEQNDPKQTLPKRRVSI